MLLDKTPIANLQWVKSRLHASRSLISTFLVATDADVGRSWPNWPKGYWNRIQSLSLRCVFYFYNMFTNLSESLLLYWRRLPLTILRFFLFIIPDFEALSAWASNYLITIIGMKSPRWLLIDWTVILPDLDAKQRRALERFKSLDHGRRTHRTGHGMHRFSGTTSSWHGPHDIFRPCG